MKDTLSKIKILEMRKKSKEKEKKKVSTNTEKGLESQASNATKIS